MDVNSKIDKSINEKKKLLEKAKVIRAKYKGLKEGEDIIKRGSEKVLAPVTSRLSDIARTLLVEKEEKKEKEKESTYPSEEKKDEESKREGGIELEEQKQVHKRVKKERRSRISSLLSSPNQSSCKGNRESVSPVELGYELSTLDHDDKDTPELKLSPTITAKSLRSYKGQKGGGLLPLRAKVPMLSTEYRYFNTLEELVERLEILWASRLAGNNGVDNEILAVEEELREEGIIE
jgi:hypothetical protein